MTPKPKSIAVHSLKRFSFFVLPAFFLVLAVFFGWQRLAAPAHPADRTEQNFIINKGEDLSTISLRLTKAGLIKNDFFFKIAVLAKGLSRSIQPGSYEVSASMSPWEIIDLLVSGPSDIWVTFPEGWRREEYGQRLKSNLPDFNSEEFLEATKDLEGQLFPDTYLFPKSASTSLIVSALTNNFKKKFSPELENEASQKGLTSRQVLILASLVEREAKLDGDRPIIAGILIKRWRNNWPLQVDASLQYALAIKTSSTSSSQDWWPIVQKSDLETNSQFNTYKYKGLPPTPICNSGMASIRGVIHYQETPYWFYLSDKKGQTHYAVTLEEHNQNIAKYL